MNCAPEGERYLEPACQQLAPTFDKSHAPAGLLVEGFGGGLKEGGREGKSRNDYSELGHDPCLALAQDRKITKLGFDHVTRCDLTGFP